MSIEIGDLVSVNKDDACMNLILRAKVLHVPVATGDSWGFLDLDSQNEIWTTERITIIKRPTP